MTFSDDLKRFSAKVETRTQAAFVGMAASAKESIVSGSPITGSPGQPVDTGALRESWQMEFEDEHTALISTNVVYAPHNEHGITEDGRPYTQRSAIGGRHSVALTLAGAQRFFDAEAERLNQ